MKLLRVSFLPISKALAIGILSKLCFDKSNPIKNSLSGEKSKKDNSIVTVNFQRTLSRAF